MDALAVTRHRVVTSTSDLAAEAARAGAVEGTAFRGDVQTGGRGRHGRRWVSAEGNLHVSVVLRPGRPRGEWPSLSLMAALALHDAVRGFRDAARLGLKWPNDVLLDGRKCAGLLLETAGGAVILGCGVNCLSAPGAVPGWPPGSLGQREGDAPVSADDMLAALEVSLPARYNLWQSGGFGALRGDWLAAAAHVGTGISLDLGGGDVREGLFETVGDDGAIHLRCDDPATGRPALLEFQAGDVLRAVAGGPAGGAAEGARDAAGN